MIRSFVGWGTGDRWVTGRRELECCDVISTEERRAGALFSRDAVGWPRYQISSIESSMWSPSPDGNHWWGSAVSQGRVPVCQMATLSIGCAQTSSRVCPVQPSSQGRFAGSWSRLPLEFPALGAERGWLGAPFPSDPSHLVPSAPRPPSIATGANLVAIRGSVSIFLIFGPRLS